jgi:hypothetical protein
MRENLTKPLTIESFAEYDKMDPVKRKAIEAQLFKSGQVEKYREKKIKKFMKKNGIGEINSPSQKEATQHFIETQCHGIGRNIFVHKDAWLDYKTAMEKNLPCGYMWIEDTDLKNLLVWAKNGLANTGKLSSIKERVATYKTRGRKIIIDVLIDDYFATSTVSDQILNEDMQSDYYSEYKIRVVPPEERATKEDVEVPRELLFDLPQLKRNTLGKKLNKKFTRKTFYSNDSQEECLTKLFKNFRNPNSSQYFLLDCVMRFGKSFIFFEFIKREYVDKGINKIHAVACHDTKTQNGWISKADIYYTDLFDCIILQENKGFDFKQKVNKNTIVFISQQLLHANKSTCDVTETSTKPLKQLIELDVMVENTFVDEAHQYFSHKWKSYWESITENLVIPATGTAANIKLKYPDLFDENNTHTDTLLDLIERLFIDYGITVEPIIKRIEISDLGSKFINLGNLQSLDEFGHLVNPGLADKFFDKLFKGFRTSPMTPECISTDNPKHFPIYVETVAFGRAMYNYLERNPDLNIKPIMAAGSLKDRTIKDEAELQNTINMAHSDGLSTGMITAGSMIQGIGIEEFKELINLSAKSTYELFYQFFGRGWEIDVIKMAGKTVQVTMWDYDPSRILKVGAQFVESLAMTKGLSISAAFKIFFQIHNIWDFVPNTAGTNQPSFREIKDTSSIQFEISEFVDSQVMKRGTRARLIGNVRPEVIGDFSKDFLEVLLKTKGGVHKTKSKKLESYKNDLDKQKSNYSKKSHDIDIPKIPKDVKDIWESAVDGLNAYTVRIPMVTELMYGEGKIKTKNINELIKHYDDELFISGFRLPNSTISKEFSKWIDKRCDKIKINVKVDDETDLIPEIKECLDLPLKEFLEKGDVFDEIYKYGGDDTQLTVRQAYYLLTHKRYEIELQKIRAKVGQVFNVPHAKSGSLNLAVAYILYNNSKKIFGTRVTKDEIINSVTYHDETYSNDVLVGRMGFIKSSIKKKDFIIINPPWKHPLHIDIFIVSFDNELKVGGTLICLQPATPFITKKDVKESKNIKRIKQIFLENKTRLVLINGNEIFDIDQEAPVSCSTVTKEKNNYIEVKNNYYTNSNKLEVHRSFDTIFIHGNLIVKSIKEKIDKLNNDSIEDNLYRKTKKYKKCLLKINAISTGPPKNGKPNGKFQSIISKKYENRFDDILFTKDSTKNSSNEITFETKKEALNCFKYLLTKFARFAVSIYKLNQNLHRGELKGVPYMDFNQKWDDEKLFEYFKLDPEEIDFINEYIQDWYEYEQDTK